jgi:hypothetical protein
MKKLIFLAAFLLIGLFASPAKAEVYSHNEHFFNTAEQIHATWDVATGAQSYELRLLHKRRAQYYPVTDLDGDDTDNHCYFTLPRSGHYYLEIRSVATVNGELLYSEWVTSRDMFVTGWWLYGYPAPPTNPIIETGEGK